MQNRAPSLPAGGATLPPLQQPLTMALLKTRHRSSGGVLFVALLATICALAIIFKTTPKTTHLDGNNNDIDTTVGEHSGVQGDRLLDRRNDNTKLIQVGSAKATAKTRNSNKDNKINDAVVDFWFQPSQRCDWVLQHFYMRDRDDDDDYYYADDTDDTHDKTDMMSESRNATVWWEQVISSQSTSSSSSNGSNAEAKKERYEIQGATLDAFLRGTAHHFWMDFANQQWGEQLLRASLLVLDDTAATTTTTTATTTTTTTQNSTKLHEDFLQSIVENRRTWTWITGDQHLGNFGSYKNQHGDVVFAMNDFDEAAIYDFHVDIVRTATSIVHHVRTTKMLKDDNDDDDDKDDDDDDDGTLLVLENLLMDFCASYLDTVLSYVNNNDALLFEWTSDTATGKVRDFLRHVEEKNSHRKMLDKFTVINDQTGRRQFITEEGNDSRSDKKKKKKKEKKKEKKQEKKKKMTKKKLLKISPQRYKDIVEALSPSKYGTTLLKLERGAAFERDSGAYTVLDVAQRIGSGIGSYGVERYYILLQGPVVSTNRGNYNHHQEVILDVKYQPRASVEYILSPEEHAWYDSMFENSADRTVQAQRQLTSYTDPYTGWVLLTNGDAVASTQRSYSVRQRSPYKDELDLEKDFTRPQDLAELLHHIAVVMATSHVRGSTAKSPAAFKDVFHEIFGSEKRDSTGRRESWKYAVARLALEYYEQVHLDFSCFQGILTNLQSGND